jgi:hypothetical protein
LDKSKQDSDETCQNADLEKSDSVENTNSDSTKEDEVKMDFLITEHYCFIFFFTIIFIIVVRRNSTGTFCFLGKSHIIKKFVKKLWLAGTKNLTVKIFERSKSLESEPVALSTPSSPKAAAGIVQDRIARFRKLTERGNRDPKTRRSSSVPYLNLCFQQNRFSLDQHFGMFRQNLVYFYPKFH